MTATPGATLAADRRAGGTAGAWLAFAACLIGVFMQMIDATIVNVALPRLTHDLHASRSQQLLVVAGYSLAFACALLTAARVGELLGRRVVFLVSAVGFTLASAACALTQTAPELVCARVIQGIAGAGMAAQTIAILTAGFPRERHAPVFALYGAVAGFAGMLGPVVGGTVMTLNLWGSGWHMVFLINVPLGLVAFVLALRYLRLGRAAARDRLDWRAVALSTASLAVLLCALAQIQQRGWRPGLVAMLLGALVLGAAFLGYERASARSGGAVLVRQDLFAHRGFRIGSILVCAFFGMFAAFVFAISITFQDVLGFSPLRTGLSMMPFAIGAGVGALVSTPVVRRFGSWGLAAGMALYAGCIAAGGVYLWITSGAVNSLVAVGPVFLSGLGIGVFGVQVQPTMLAGLDYERLAETSGLLPTIEQIGNAVGLAVLTTLFFRAHTLHGSITMMLAIAALALGLAGLTVALPAPEEQR